MTQLIHSVEQTMTSNEIANLTRKRHADVLRDIRELNEIYEKLHLRKIAFMFKIKELPNNGQKKDPFCELTKIQTFDLLTGYSRELRIIVNRRWAELEEKSRVEAVSDHGRIQQLERGGKHLATKSALKEKQRELMSYIRRYLKKGDIKRVSVETGIGYSSVQDVMGGMFRNDEVISALYQRALHNKRELLFDFDEMIDELKI